MRLFGQRPEGLRLGHIWSLKLIQIIEGNRQLSLTWLGGIEGPGLGLQGGREVGEVPKW